MMQIVIALMAFVGVIQGQIVEWIPTDWVEYPFAVAINVQLSDGTSGGCSGSIVSKDECEHGVILTAAHCVYNASSIDVFIGCTKEPCADDPKAVEYSSHMYTVHDLFDGNQLIERNDIALIYLDCAITEPSEAREVYIPDVNDILSFPHYTHGRIVSYGGKCTDEIIAAGKCAGGSNDKRLDYADFDLINLTECSQQLSTQPGQFDTCFIDRDYSDGQQSLCSGDSGAPILYKDDNHIQLSLVSWGDKYCDASVPAVGPYLPLYKDWIQNMLLYFCTGNDANFTFDMTQFQCATSNVGTWLCDDGSSSNYGPGSDNGRRMLDSDGVDRQPGDICICNDTDITSSNYGPSGDNGRRILDTQIVCGCDCANYNMDSCKNMKLTIQNYGCRIIQIQNIECAQLGACVGAEMDLIGAINVNYCNFAGQPPMGYAFDAKCGMV